MKAINAINKIGMVVILIFDSSSKAGSPIRKSENMSIAKSILKFKIDRAIILYIINPGNKPNVTISAKLSRSFPIGELTFNKRAVKPSKKSRTAAITNR